MSDLLSERMRGIDKTLIRRVNDKADASCLNLGLGELAFPTPSAILDRLKDEVKTWPLGYTANAGLPELRRLVADRSGFNVPADRVCITVGAEEAIFALLMVLAGPGDEVLVPDPGFPAYPMIVRMTGAATVPYVLSAEQGFDLNVDDIARRITPKTKVVIVNSPHNPTGAVYSPEDLRALAALCARNNLIVLSDEVYREILFEVRAESIGRYHDGTVVINSLSKTYSMTGWRLGWCIGPQEIIQGVETFNQLAISCPPAICQRAAILALQGVADEEIKSYGDELRKRRDLALRCLDGIPELKVVRPRGAFYLYADISAVMPQGMNALDVALDIIAREKVVTIPGSAFGRSAEHFLRVSFAAPPDTIEEGLRRLGRYFRRG